MSYRTNIPAIFVYFVSKLGKNDEGELFRRPTKHPFIEPVPERSGRQFAVKNCGRQTAPIRRTPDEANAGSRGCLLQLPAQFHHRNTGTSPVGLVAARTNFSDFSNAVVSQHLPCRNDLGLTLLDGHRGGLQDRGVGSRRGSKLTGIRQGKLRRRIRKTVSRSRSVLARRISVDQVTPVDSDLLPNGPGHP
jgi:hypothetical protein